MHQRWLIPLSMFVVGIGLSGCVQLSPPSTVAPPSPPAKVAPSVSDLVDATIASGEAALTSRGYTAAVTQHLATYWWHPFGTCVRIETVADHFKAVEPAAASACGH
jgi:hypothetical protein